MGAALVIFTNAYFCPCCDFPFPRVVYFANFFRVVNNSARWKVWTLQKTHKFINGCMWIVNEFRNCLCKLAQIVWRNICCHPNSDTNCAIEKKLWQSCWHDGWLLMHTIKV